MTTLKQLFNLLNKNHICLDEVSFSMNDLFHCLCKSTFENVYSKYGSEFIECNINKFVDAIINASTYIRLMDPNRCKEIIETPTGFQECDVYNGNEGYLRLEFYIDKKSLNIKSDSINIADKCEKDFFTKMDFTNEIKYLKDIYDINLSSKDASEILSLTSKFLYILLSNIRDFSEEIIKSVYITGNNGYFGISLCSYPLILLESYSSKKSIIDHTELRINVGLTGTATDDPRIDLDLYCNYKIEKHLSNFDFIDLIYMVREFSESNEKENKTIKIPYFSGSNKRKYLN